MNRIILKLGTKKNVCQSEERVDHFILPGKALL